MNTQRSGQKDAARPARPMAAGAMTAKASGELVPCTESLARSLGNVKGHGQIVIVVPLGQRADLRVEADNESTQRALEPLAAWLRKALAPLLREATT